MFTYIIVVALSIALFRDVFFGKKNTGWKIVDPAKKGGSFSLYFMDKHIANVRGKTKAMVLLSAIQGKDITNTLEMPVAKTTVKPVAKKVSKPVAKKVAAKKVVAKTTKKVAAKKVTKKAKK